MRQDVPEEDTQAPGAQGRRAIHVGTSQLGARLRVHEACNGHPARHPEHEYHLGSVWRPQRGEKQEQYDARNTERKVGEAEQHRRHAAWCERGAGPDRDTKHQRQGHCQHTNRERDPRAEEEPRPDVAAEAVGAEKVERAMEVTRHRGEESCHDHVLCTRRRGKERRDRGKNDEERQHADTNAGPRIRRSRGVVNDRHGSAATADRPRPRAARRAGCQRQRARR